MSLTTPSSSFPSNKDPASYIISRGRQGTFHLLVTRCQTRSTGTGASNTHLPLELGHCTIPIPQHLTTCQLPPRGPLGQARSNSCETPCRTLPACSRARSPAFPPSRRSPLRTQLPQQAEGSTPVLRGRERASARSPCGCAPSELRAEGRDRGASHRTPRDPEGRDGGGSTGVSPRSSRRRAAEAPIRLLTGSEPGSAWDAPFRFAGPEAGGSNPPFATREAASAALSPAQVCVWKGGGGLAALGTREAPAAAAATPPPPPPALTPTGAGSRPSDPPRQRPPRAPPPPPPPRGPARAPGGWREEEGWGGKAGSSRPSRAAARAPRCAAPRPQPAPPRRRPLPGTAPRCAEPRGARRARGARPPSGFASAGRGRFFTITINYFFTEKKKLK